jgi:iron complex transport system substrate-binding protein
LRRFFTLAVGYTIHGVFGRKNGAFDNICTEAGVVNGAADYIQHRGNQLSKEQILKIDPDVIICSVDAVDSKMLQEILHDPSFQDLKAIKNKKVFSIEERYMYNTTQYFADAVEVLAKTMYPECF